MEYNRNRISLMFAKRYFGELLIADRTYTWFNGGDVIDRIIDAVMNCKGTSFLVDFIAENELENGELYLCYSSTDAPQYSPNGEAVAKVLKDGRLDFGISPFNYRLGKVVA